MDTVPQKICTSCCVELLITDFFKHSMGALGVESRCKACKKFRRHNGFYKTSPWKPSGYRLCSVCETFKELTTEFYAINRSRPEGFELFCKCCHKVRNATFRAENPEKVKEYAKKARPRKTEWWRRKRDADPEKMRLIQQERYIQNKAQILAYSKVYREKYPEKRKFFNARWARENPEKGRQNRQNRRARVASAEGSFTAAEWQAKLKVYQGRCHWCHKKIKDAVHADHVIALAVGGTNYIDNVVPACAKCNLSKGARTPLEFAGRLF